LILSLQAYRQQKRMMMTSSDVINNLLIWSSGFVVGYVMSEIIDIPPRQLKMR
jgi:hypothetical protein